MVKWRIHTFGYQYLQGFAFIPVRFSGLPLLPGPFQRIGQLWHSVGPVFSRAGTGCCYVLVYKAEIAGRNIFSVINRAIPRTSYWYTRHGAITWSDFKTDVFAFLF